VNRWLFLFRQQARQLWFRATTYALFAIIAALSSVALARFVPKDLADRLGGNAVETVLGILASSLLAVATFSVGSMVSAYTAVSAAASPRVAELITADTETQKSLSTFVGVFLYAIVALTAVNAGYYGPEGRTILFLFSMAVVALVAYRLLAWINRLGSLARVSHMIELVEKKACQALADRAHKPWLGGRPGHLPNGEAIAASKTGHVQNVDVAALQSLAEKDEGLIEIVAPPGTFVRQGDTLARTTLPLTADTAAQDIAEAFVIESRRSFDQDPRFGLTVLGEIAARALSPGVNDPGTAIEVMASGVRLLNDWAGAAPEEAMAYPQILAAPLDAADLLEDIFGPVGRYGAGDLSVALWLQKALQSLAAIQGALGAAAAERAERELSRARQTLTLDADRARLARETAG
jgi:uncharacterized membrane protein